MIGKTDLALNMLRTALTSHPDIEDERDELTFCRYVCENLVALLQKPTETNIPPVTLATMDSFHETYFPARLAQISARIEQRTEVAERRMGRAVGTIVEIVANNGVITTLYVSKPITNSELWWY